MNVASSIHIGRGLDWVGLLLALSLTLVIAVPLIVVGIWAFADVWRYPSLIPQQFGVRYWFQTLSRYDVWDDIFTSVKLTITVTLLSAVICLPAAYAFARMKFPGRNLLFFSFLIGSAFPNSVSPSPSPPCF